MPRTDRRRSKKRSETGSVQCWTRSVQNREQDRFELYKSNNLHGLLFCTSAAVTLNFDLSPLTALHLQPQHSQLSKQSKVNVKVKK